MVMTERDEELALFLEMRRREKEKEKNNLLLNNSDELDAPSLGGINGGGSPMSKIMSFVPPRKTAADKFLDSENDKSDYDWLLTPPRTPLFPSLDMESQKTRVSQMGMSNARPTALKSRLVNLPEEPALRSNLTSKNPNLPSSTGNRRPSSSSGLTSTTRAPTPTGRPTLTTTAKPSRPSTPTSRATLPSSKPAPPAVRSSTPTRSIARSSTPTARPTMTASKPAPRSATPTSKSTSRAATPTSRATSRSATPTSKTASRSATPTRGPSAPSSAPSVSAPPRRSSSVSKSGSTMLKNPVPSRGTSPNPVPSRGTSPTVKSRPLKPIEMPGFSLDAPPNLRTSLPERPASASRGRPGAPTAQLSSVETRRRQQSCSPSRGRTTNGSTPGKKSSIPSMRRGNASGSISDDVSPVEMGNRMVERVVNMRKLAPPKHEYHLSTHNNSNGKLSSSHDSLGIGRTLSKKSLDMAMRHMDIRRSIPGNNLRPLMTNIPASSMYSVRSGSTRSRTVSVSDSPLATSSCSSEPSVNNNYFCLDESEVDDNNDFASERGNTSPSSQRGR